MRWRYLDGGPWGLGGGYAWTSAQHPCTVSLGPCEVVGKGPEGGQEGTAGHSPEASPPPAPPHEPAGLLEVWSTVPEMFL